MKLSNQILLAFTFIVSISIIDSCTNYRLSLKVQHNTEFVSKSENIVRNSAMMHKTIIETQGAFRGFLLTEDTTFLNSYYRGILQMKTVFEEQDEMIKENPLQKILLDSIYNLHHEWVEYANALIYAKKKVLEQKQDADYNNLFENKLKKQVGKKINDDIDMLFWKFDKHEYKVRAERREALIKSIERTHLFSYLFIIAIIVVGVGSSMYIFTLISRRIKSMVELAGNISKGEFTHIKDNRNDELTGLSRSLNVMSEKLSRNIKEMEKTNTELNQFAYVVSHDLKAPVRGIVNVVQWIQEDLGNELSEQMKKYLGYISQRTLRMENLINGLLDYARIREKTTVEQIDTNLLVNDIADTIVPRHIRVDTHNLPQLYSERLKLEQVFTNLISNSVKYTANGSGHIIISCKELKHFYEFSVKDNGIGIAPEYHEKIFELFQTLREKDDKESTGIGLAIVKKIIDEQHCTIKVNSEAGKGAEFIFTWRNN